MSFEVVGILLDRRFVFLNRILNIAIALELYALPKMAFRGRGNGLCLGLRIAIGGRRRGLLRFAGRGYGLLLRQARCRLRLRSILRLTEPRTRKRQKKKCDRTPQRRHFHFTIFHDGLQEYIADGFSKGAALLLLRLDLRLLRWR